MNNRLNLELHPLQNVEILSTIFRFCSVNDLKNCRLVGSKLWLKASLSSWRENAVLRIKSVIESSSNHNSISIRDLQIIHEDEKDSLLFQKKPFKNYKLKDISFHMQDSEWTWFFEKCSRHIRHLSLHDCEFVLVDEFLDVILLKLTNLVELKLEGYLFFITYIHGNTNAYPKHAKLKSIALQMYDDQWDPATMSIMWERLITNANELEELLIKPPSDGRKAFDGKEIMEIVAKIRSEDKSRMRIKNLEIRSVPLTASRFTGTAHLDSMPLERFIGTTDDIMHLKPYSESLKYLNLSFTEENDNALDQKISLPFLKEFHADGPPSQVFRNLNKLEAVNLEKLVVNDSSSSSPRLFHRFRFRKSVHLHLNKLANSSFGNVTKLDWVHVVDVDDFTHLSQSMPNVKHAKITLTREAFQELCKTWRNLLTLTISDRSTGIDDETITGIKICSDGDLDGVCPEVKTVSNIRNLKVLTDFEYSGTLTGHSVKFGFLPLPRLHYLNIKLNKISEKALSELRKKVTILEIEVYND